MQGLLANLTPRVRQTQCPSQVQSRRIHLSLHYLVCSQSRTRRISCSDKIDSESSSSNLTTSDKLSALPGIQSSPALGRFYGARTPRRSFDASTSLPAIQSSPAFSPPSRLPTPASRYSESDGSAHGRETPRQRVSFDSDRASLPAAVRSLKQGEQTSLHPTTFSLAYCA